MQLPSAGARGKYLLVEDLERVHDARVLLASLGVGWGGVGVGWGWGEGGKRKVRDACINEKGWDIHVVHGQEIWVWNPKLRSR